jgi:hypothetical protein
MKQITFILLLALQVILAGCAKTGPATAAVTILISVGNPPKAIAEENGYIAAVFKSFDVSQHANHTFGLAKLWGVSDTQAAQKLGESISVKNGSGPGLYIVEIHGLDHDLSVRILNDLCAYYSSLHISSSVNGGPVEENRLSIVEPAK